MICKTNTQLLAFAKKIGNKFYDLHGLCYSDKSNNVFDQENDALIDQRDCFYQYLVNELSHDIENEIKIGIYVMKLKSIFKPLHKPKDPIIFTDKKVDFATLKR